jgi:hypothetical protein
LFLFVKGEKDGGDYNPESRLRIADPDRLARLFNLTSIEEVPEVKDIHRLLMEPEELEEELSNQDDEGKIFLLNWLIAYAPSCEKPDIKGCINKLTKISQQLTNQSPLKYELTNRTADLMIQLLRLKSSDYEQCFLDIANNSSLSISEKIVLRAAQEQGKWVIRPSDQENSERQLISSDTSVDSAIKTWSKRVRKSIRKKTLYQEARLHPILYRFAQFNGNDYAEVHKAIDQMCQTEKGLTAFLGSFEKGDMLNTPHFDLIEDADKFKQYIVSSSLKEKYDWFIELLSRADIVELIKEQQTKLKPSNTSSQ